MESFSEKNDYSPSQFWFRHLYWLLIFFVMGCFRLLPEFEVLKSVSVIIAMLLYSSASESETFRCFRHLESSCSPVHNNFDASHISPSLMH